MNNFDLKKFLVENKLTTNSKTLVTEAMSMNDLDSMKIVTNVNESTAYQCNTCGERAEHEEIEENPRMRCSNCGDRSWSPEY
jgi:DNA-directed RNA polymerase subunit RPC12/RpoP